MKYYQIDVSAEPKIIGVTNGIYQVEIEKKAMQENIAYKEFLDFFNSKNKSFWQNQDMINSIKIPVIKAKLLKKAKITDIMGYTENISFLNNVFSQKYINILKAFDVDSFNVFEIKIENILEEYYLLFMNTIPTEKLNFEKSIIYTGHKLRNNIRYYNIKNFEEYLELIKSAPLSKFEKISISKEYFGKDVINIQSSPFPFYSERLIDFLLDCGITGLQVGYNNSIQLEFI